MAKNTKPKKSSATEAAKKKKIRELTEADLKQISGGRKADANRHKTSDAT